MIIYEHLSTITTVVMWPSIICKMVWLLKINSLFGWRGDYIFNRIKNKEGKGRMRIFLGSSDILDSG